MSAPTGGPARVGRVVMRILSVHGLLALLVLVFVIFSIAKPATFPTAFNVRSIVSDKGIVVLVALAEMVVVAANQFDLSVGYGIGLGQILVIGLQTREGLSWPAAALAVMAIGLVIGVVNGLLVTRAHIDSFIATLGVGTVLYGVSEWYTGGAQILGNLPPAFSAIAGNVLGIPMVALYVVVIGIGLWVVFEYLPLGRYLYVLGANPRAAELSGISSRRYIVLAFAASGLLTGFAGVVLGARLGVGQSSVGPDYLLPAFVGALLGATSVRPGRANVWGTVLAVLLLGVAVAGLEQLGAQFYVESLFNGAMLVLAVGLAGYAARRRLRTAAAARGLDASGSIQAPPSAGPGTDPSPLERAAAER